MCRSDATEETAAFVFKISACLSSWLLMSLQLFPYGLEVQETNSRTRKSRFGAWVQGRQVELQRRRLGERDAIIPTMLLVSRFWFGNLTKHFHSFLDLHLLVMSPIVPYPANPAASQVFLLALLLYMRSCICMEERQKGGREGGEGGGWVGEGGGRDGGA